MSWMSEIKVGYWKENTMFKPAETRVKGVKAKKKHQSIRTERIGM